MKLVFAQGNPGTTYNGTRHNVGFYMIDAFAKKHDATWQEKSKFHALIAEITIDGEKVILAKPTTFYNETGLSARAITDFYKLEPSSDILVLHDELALPFGTLRTRSSGSDAGNNGIKSLNAALGNVYKRLRIGIYNDIRDRVNDVDFVIGKFNREESETLPNIYELAQRHIDDFISDAHTDETVKVQ